MIYGGRYTIHTMDSPVGPTMEAGKANEPKRIVTLSQTVQPPVASRPR